MTDPLSGRPGEERPRWFGNRAATAPDHTDPRLRGRRYAIPFSEVWAAALELADGGLRGWTVEHADEIEGVVRATAVSLVFRFVDAVEIRIGLDEDAQTRVDVRSASLQGKWDLGANGRRIRRFLRKLDRTLAAPPELILDPGEGARPARAGPQEEPGPGAVRQPE